MPVKTHIDHARTRVQTEQEAVDAKLEAFEMFIDRVADISTDPTPSSASGITTTAGTRTHSETSTGDRSLAVRTAFAETVQPHSAADTDTSGSLLATIQNELTNSIALALVPTSEISFSAALKQTIITKATARRTEAKVLRRALAREESHLKAASESVEVITTWMVDANETPLTALDFETLQHRHETLANHCTRCEELAQQRQEFLQATTSHDGEAGLRHQSLIPYLYEDFPVDHPVLVTVTRLDATCKRCQRTVRNHLAQRA
ncbi:DUF7260 family protein [Haladaptatus salinisoli]|uniref:DUF7260 family protein n=1 Tax=Haladaptatus salinisoli TaxID=2884876 RepID=UPI001D0A7219|nr:hypothetical protein [Haladaptatus salinisoli]